MKTSLRASGVYFPWSLVEEFEKADCSIPPDVVKALGPEAAEELEAYIGPSSEMPIKIEGEDWWLRGLPLFIKKLLLDRRLDKEYYDEMLAHVNRDLDTTRNERNEAWDRETELETENQRLREMLQKSIGKEQALHEVIKWHLEQRSR